MIKLFVSEMFNWNRICILMAQAQEVSSLVYLTTLRNQQLTYVLTFALKCWVSVLRTSVHSAESVQIIISCLQRTMQCNNVMLVMINHPTLFHSLAGRAAAVKLQWVSKLLLLLTAQLTTQILASQTAVQTENWLQRKLQEMIYANLASRGRNIAIKFAIWKSALIVRVSWYLCL